MQPSQVPEVLRDAKLAEYLLALPEEDRGIVFGTIEATLARAELLGRLPVATAAALLHTIPMESRAALLREMDAAHAAKLVRGKLRLPVLECTPNAARGWLSSSSCYRHVNEHTRTHARVVTRITQAMVPWCAACAAVLVLVSQRAYLSAFEFDVAADQTRAGVRPIAKWMASNADDLRT